VTVAQDEADPPHVLVIAEWDSAEHHDAHLAWRAGEGAVPELPALMVGLPVRQPRPATSASEASHIRRASSALWRRP
jgi:quinol monooxygenase YgiN